MSSGKVSRYRLTPRVIEDLDGIWRYTAETWSIEQADRYIDDLARIFDALVAFPTMARERAQFAPPARIHTHEGHLIVYQVADGEIIIVRILGGSHDWAAVLKAADQS